ncbi:MAG: tight adherence protein [Actinomycetota bacterium]|nr:tight adherence protein [Actinomycetota bacterium]
MTDVFARHRVLRRLTGGPSSAGDETSGPPIASWARGTAVVMVAMIALSLGPGAVVAGGAAVLGGRAFWHRLGESRHRARAAVELAADLEAVARSLRTGASLRQALAEAGGVRGGEVVDGLAAVAARNAAGEGLDDALSWWAATTDAPGATLAAAALGLGLEAGGAQARAIDAVAATLRQRLAAAGQARALAAQARTSALVIGLAPVAFCALATMTDPRTAAFLFRSVPGAVVLAAGLALDLLGGLWMHRITQSVAP